MERNIWEFRIRKKCGSKENTLFAISISFVLIAWILTPFLLHEFSKDRGTFGDMYGSVNALFSGLAFCGLVYAILLQQKELSLTREELSIQANALINQQKTMKLDLFETGLIKRLELIKLQLEGISYHTGSGVKTGIDAILAFANIGHPDTGKQTFVSDEVLKKTSNSTALSQLKGCVPLMRTLSATLHYAKTAKEEIDEKDFTNTLLLISAQFDFSLIMVIRIYCLQDSDKAAELNDLCKEFNIFQQDL